MTPGTRLIGYVRCSTDEQGASGLGLEAQETRLRKTCEAEGWDLLEIRRAVVSGGTHRPKVLTSILDDVEAGRADGLIVSHIDRLTRRMRDFEEYVSWASEGGYQLVVLDPYRVDTSSPTGLFVARILVAAGELERDNASARTKGAMAAKRARGERIGRPLECSAADRRTITALRSEGLSLQRIADRLNAAGSRRKSGAPWAAKSVQRVLNSPNGDA